MARKRPNQPLPADQTSTPLETSEERTDAPEDTSPETDKPEPAVNAWEGLTIEHY